MLKKRERLSKREFDSYFKEGRRHHFPEFTLIYTPHHNFHGAVVVGKKISKKAVLRNQLRRRLYHALYSLKQSEDLHGVFMILTKPAAVERSFSELKQALSAAVGRAQKTR